jgi:hypothetical protein
MAMVIINAETGVPPKHSSAVKTMNSYDESLSVGPLFADIETGKGQSRARLSKRAR